MKLLVDIGHPAHVHLFRFMAEDLRNEGWEILFSLREKDHSSDIARSLGFDLACYGKTRKTLIGKALSYFQKTFKLFLIARQFKPDITISHSSFYLSQVSWLLGIPNLTLEDTGNTEQILLYLPFTSAVLTSTSYHREHGRKQIRYKAFHELAYLHPGHYERLFGRDILNRKSNPRPVILIRLVNWSASHDLNRKGIDPSWVEEIILRFSADCQIMLSAEGEAGEMFHELLIPGGKVNIHTLLSGIDLYVGEGATMASECAMMGIPAIYLNPIPAGTIDEQSKYGLVYHLTGKQEIIRLIERLTSDPLATAREHQQKARKLLADRINLSEFLCWFVKEWPSSFEIMKREPDYQDRFLISGQSTL